MSDFSSWGPTPDLKIKPEITAHGGNILSAVTGGSYDRLSGTSMACPNLAGVVVLLRQYVTENFPEIADDEVKVTALIYQLLMSTADIALSTNGLPYAVRKQGAGLANLYDAMATTAVITTYDANGKAMDKTKLELGDDPAKTGVYTMSFTVENFGSTALSYDIGAYIMTEGVSDTLTNAGQTTVTEQGYLLTGASLEIVSVTGGSLSEKNLTVAAGQNASVTVKITLSDADKAYLDASFKNGMYVEGFITLTATAGTEVDMSVPYLAFYGDWTKAPMFDKDFYETNADELNNAIDEEDKNKADAYAVEEDELLITADTIVYCKGEVLGKPVDEADACRMLRQLSGCTHQVVTGVTLKTQEQVRTFSCTTQVTFAELSDEEITYYVQHYAPYDKAGAYGVQEWIGFVGVTRLEGSYFNVMGLPVCALGLSLRQMAPQLMEETL